MEKVSLMYNLQAQVPEIVLKDLKESKYPNITVPSIENNSNWEPTMPDIELQKVNAGSVPIEIYNHKDIKPSKVVLLFHGGAYVAGVCDMYRRVAERLASEITDAYVILFDYRVAPKYRHPAALLDAVEVCKFLQERYANLDFEFLGDSAGGHLATTTTLALKQQNLKMPTKLALLSPWTDPSMNFPSRKYNHCKDVILGWQTEESAGPVAKQVLTPLYFSDVKNVDEFVTPVNGDLQGFPETLIIAGQYEVLLSDALGLFEVLTASGVPASLHVQKGMPHNCWVLQFKEEAEEIFKMVCDHFK